MNKRIIAILSIVILLIVVIFSRSILFKENTSINSEPLVTIVKYGADWWPACGDLDETLKSLEKKYGKRITIKRIDVDKIEAMEDIKKYNIQGIPFVVLFNKDNEEVTNFVGEKTVEEFESLLKSKELLY